MLRIQKKVRQRRRERYHRYRANILKGLKEKRLSQKSQLWKSCTKQQQQQKITRYVNIAPKPTPREPPTTTMLELIQDVFPDILQVFIE